MRLESAMNVSVTPELEEFVQARVYSGRYNSANEVVLHALWHLEDVERVRVALLNSTTSCDSGLLQSPGLCVPTRSVPAFDPDPNSAEKREREKARARRAAANKAVPH